MHRIEKIGRAGAVWIALAALCAAAPGAGGPSADEGEATLALRLRVEDVAQDGVTDATATTLRSTLSYRTAAWRRWSLFVEAENVAEIGDDDFANAGAGGLDNGMPGRAIIADVALTEVNQAFARLELDRLDLRVGRQEINIADQRLVGAVGWRQNHQSFDAVRLDAVAAGSVDLTYVYLDRIHRIFGDSRDTSSHFLQAEAEVGPVTLRGYGLRLSRETDLGVATRTLGVELTGKRPLGSRPFVWEVEAARQDEVDDAQGIVDAGYLHLMVGTDLGPVATRLGLEILEGSAGEGRFSTPLATLHKFNGWADKFLQTPVDGLEDLYLSLSGGRGAWRWTVVGHDFGAESSSRDLGSEIDGQLTWTSDWKQTFGIKLADYRADAHATDTRKWMVWTQYSF